MQDKINLTIEIDIDALKASISRSKALEDNDKVFAVLSSIAAPKIQLKQALEVVEGIEREIKQLISDKAQTLYGSDWNVIQGTGYRISRQKSGALYELNGEPDKRFVKITRSINSDAVTEFVKGNGKLPEGVAINTNRTEVIKLTVSNEETQSP